MDLDRNAILGLADLPRKRVDVPEWNVTGYVRMLTGAERDRYEQKFVSPGGGRRDGTIENIRASLVVMTFVDDDGERVFEDGDVEMVGTKNSAAIDRIWQAAMEINKLRAEDVEELVGN